MTELKPLDLDEVRIWIEKKQDEMYEKNCVIDIDKLNEAIINEIKQRVRAACEFYLKYKDKPALFSEEQFSIIWRYDRLTGTYIVDLGNRYTEYNYWLLKEVFKNVLGEERENELGQAIVPPIELCIVTHTDADGIASAAITIYCKNVSSYKVLFTEPTDLPKSLKKVVGLKPRELIITDLGLNTSTFDEVLKILKVIKESGTNIKRVYRSVSE